MTNLKKSVRDDCAASACSPQLCIKALTLIVSGVLSLWTYVCPPPPPVASIWNKANFPFHQLGLCIGFCGWAARSHTLFGYQCNGIHVHFKNAKNTHVVSSLVPWPRVMVTPLGDESHRGWWSRLNYADRVLFLKLCDEFMVVMVLFLCILYSSILSTEVLSIKIKLKQSLDLWKWHSNLSPSWHIWVIDT